jgi:hypothetical protein
MESASHTGLGLLGRLPAELRVKIYELLLDAKPNNGLGRTLISWVGYHPKCPRYKSGYAHRAGGEECACLQGGPFVPFSHGRLDLASLLALFLTSKQISAETIPHLYAGRMFMARNFRTFGKSGFGGLVERWWIMHTFLGRLSTMGRANIRHIRLPMNLESRADFECGNAFCAIGRMLPHLETIELELLASRDLMKAFPPPDPDDPPAEDCETRDSAAQAIVDLRPLLVFADLQVTLDVTCPDARRPRGSPPAPVNTRLQKMIERTWTEMLRRPDRKDLMLQAGISSESNPHFKHEAI